jgi:hypothetical protein
VNDHWHNLKAIFAFFWPYAAACLALGLAFGLNRWLAGAVFTLAMARILFRELENM